MSKAKAAAMAVNASNSQAMLRMFGDIAFVIFVPSFLLHVGRR